MRTDSDITPPGTAPPTVDRAAALTENPPGVPRQVVVIAVVVAAVLALGGTALERIFSSAGLNPKPTLSAPSAHAGSATTSQPTLGSSMAAFLGIVDTSPAPAPAIALTDQDGLPIALDEFRGKVVVITFFDADCADACPVLAREIIRADEDVGANRPDIVFLTVNTDPLRTDTHPLPAALATSGLAALGNWHFLGGSLAALDPVWRNYGVTINASSAAGIVAHNNVLYFVDPEGRLRIRATPVADESANGAFSLPPSSVTRAGAGIAAYATGLLPAAP
jgi:cytochrome oxidase Cu insertion factor (SCO1/SenC/PrrC family)